MSALLPFLTLDQSCEQVQDWVNRQLTDAGFRLVQTFDLHVARIAHPGCPCPRHGTSGCTCQMVVLLVYQKKKDPVTLVIHGQDGRTWISLATPTGQRSNQHLEMMIRRILSVNNSNALIPNEAASDVETAI